MKKLLEVKVGTLYYKPSSKVIPDYYVDETTSWIVFPHEKYEFMNEQYQTKNMSKSQIKDYLVQEVGLKELSVDNFLKLKEANV